MYVASSDVGGMIPWQTCAISNNRLLCIGIDEISSAKVNGEYI